MFSFDPTCIYAHEMAKDFCHPFEKPDCDQDVPVKGST